MRPKPSPHQEYQAKIHREYPDYRAIAAMRIDKATRELVNRYPLDWDDLLMRPRPSYQWARAELRRMHEPEWREILRAVPGTLTDVKHGWTLDDMKEWEWR